MGENKQTKNTRPFHSRPPHGARHHHRRSLAQAEELVQAQRDAPRPLQI